MNEKEIIEKLKHNWTALGGLSKEEVEVLKKYKVHVGLWHGYKLENVGFNSINNNGLIYRINPDFQPDKKKWWFDPNSKTVWFGVIGMAGSEMEVTVDYAAYLSNKPEGYCELCIAKSGDEIYCPKTRKWRFSFDDYKDFGPNDRGFRWCKAIRSEPLKRTVLNDYSCSPVLCPVCQRGDIWQEAVSRTEYVYRGQQVTDGQEVIDYLLSEVNAMLCTSTASNHFYRTERNA